MSSKKVKVVIATNEVDSMGNKIDLNGLEIKFQEIPVYNNFDSEKLLGYANCFREDDVLKAEMIVDERYLNLPMAISLRAIEHHTDEKGIVYIDESIIHSVSICTNPPVNNCISISSKIN
jgi:hypothetical protein